MNTTNPTDHEGLTRRDLLKGTGLALGGAVLGSVGEALGGEQCGVNGCGYPNQQDTLEYEYPAVLPTYTPDMQPQLDADEMRITFLGSGFPPSRRAQQMMSIFVEVGPWVPDPNGGFGKATDSFVFDCGSGVIANYNAMGIGYGRMDKIFITHLHADHMSDLCAIYCFGPSEDRKSPLYVWGHGPSGITSPAWGGNPPRQYNDGTKVFCQKLRAAMRWHTESFSFLPTRYKGYKKPTRKSWGLPCDPTPVGDDPADDGYAMVPIELNWKQVGGVAYHNQETGVKITHFPVIHTRKGSMGYKLEWNGLSLVYTSDTRPETNCIAQANGVDVFIHEMILPPELLTMKNLGLDRPLTGQSAAFDSAMDISSTIIESSHTPQGAFGYLLSQLNPRPRLSVIAHFPVADDTVACAMKSVQAHFPDASYPVLGRDLIWTQDLMVLRVKKGQITQLNGKVSDYAFGPKTNIIPDQKTPKYHTKDGGMNPTAQLNQATLIKPTNADGSANYCENGY